MRHGRKASPTASLALLLGVALLGGCGGAGPTSGSPALPLTFVEENALARYERTVRPEPDGTLTIEVTVSARQELALLAVTEDVPAGLTLLEGETTAFRAGLQAGDRLSLRYRLRAERAGGFTLQGQARAKPLTGESVRLVLTGPVEVP